MCSILLSCVCFSSSRFFLYIRLTLPKSEAKKKPSQTKRSYTAKTIYPIRTPLTTTAPQKHYRIVFIKAPTEPPVTLPMIPLQPPDEEKTLVYVLIKKPDTLPAIVLPKAASTQPSKPEVYFIRYKTQVQYIFLR